jgi:hypothetical protein
MDDFLSPSSDALDDLEQVARALVVRPDLLGTQDLLSLQRWLDRSDANLAVVDHLARRLLAGRVP